MRVFTLVLGLIAALTASSAHADIVFSTSGTAHDAGSDLQLTLGQSGSMFVWISTASGHLWDGISLDINSSDPSVLQATAHNIANPSNRWFQTNPGTLGDLVDDGFGFALPPIGGTGLATGGLDNFVLFSEVQFSATGLGTTDLSFGIGSQGISNSGTALGPGDIVFGNGSVSVLSAVPEPGSFAALGLLGVVSAAWRRRRAKQLVALA